MSNKHRSPGTRIRRTQAERSAAPHTNLLDAAIDCIVELGYARSSTVEICRRAGVSRGAQVHHFPTKSALVLAAVERLLMRRHAEFRRSLQGVSALPDIDRAFAELWRLYSSPTLLAWFELLIAARTDAALREQLRSVDERFFEEAKQTAASLIGADEGSLDDPTIAGLGRLILSVFDGLTLSRTLGHPEPIYDASLQLFTRAVIGLREQLVEPRAAP